MRCYQSILPTISRMRRDRSGSFGVAAAAIMTTLALAGGYALNTAQLSNARSNLLAALDSAITSTARDLTTGVIAEDAARGSVEAFLFANGTTGFAQEGRLSLDDLVVDRQARTVRGQASVLVDLVFPVFSGGSQRRIVIESAAVYSDQKIEVAMMLDVTGSMAGQKLRDLKSAATNAAGILLRGQDEARPRVRVALVPYSNAVNVGTLAESSVFVETRDRDRTTAPGNAAPRSVASRPDNCATERKGTHQYSDVGPEVSMVNRDLLLSDFARDYRTATCPSARLVPLTPRLRTIETAIDGFVAEGGTAGHIGIQWSWYMLSNQWKGVLPAASQPAARHDDGTRKFAILMTDGEFNLSYYDATRVSQVYNDRGKEPPRTAARRLCQEMRDAGIEIFTIGFKLEDQKARETMAACASPDGGSVRHYFETNTGAELDAAFREIAGNIERLALTR
jgi:Flp pilus assembly protein TadG